MLTPGFFFNFRNSMRTPLSKGSFDGGNRTCWKKKKTTINPCTTKFVRRCMWELLAQHSAGINMTMSKETTFYPCETS